MPYLLIPLKKGYIENTCTLHVAPLVTFCGLGEEKEGCCQY